MNEETGQGGRRENILATASFNPKVRYYWLISGTLVLVSTIVGIPLLIFWLPLGLLLTQRYLDHMSCELTDRSINVKKGVLNRVEKTVPLDKVTDLALTQGPIMRFLDLEGLSLETAGQSGAGSLIKLIGVVNAQEFRDKVLAQRDLITTAGGETSLTSGSREALPASHELLTEMRDCLLRIEARLEKRQG